jgi:hypothetical protein
MPNRAIRDRVAMEETRQLVEIKMDGQQVPASEIEHGAMARLAVLPIARLVIAAVAAKSCSGRPLAL